VGHAAPSCVRFYISLGRRLVEQDVDQDIPDNLCRCVNEQQLSGSDDVLKPVIEPWECDDEIAGQGLFGDTRRQRLPSLQVAGDTGRQAAVSTAAVALAWSGKVCPDGCDLSAGQGNRSCYRDWRHTRC